MAIKRIHQCDTGNVLTKHLWDSTLGRQVLGLETTVLGPFIRRFHGDSVLWVGAHAESANALQRCMVRNALFLQQDQAGGSSDVCSLAGQLETLPFKSASLDGVVLHHALEKTSDPRVALREVTRVLVPGGRVVICVFNPFSMIGLRRLYARLFSDPMSGYRLLNPIRLFDWLTLLGFELEGNPVYSGYTLPFRRLTQNFDLPFLKDRESDMQVGAIIPFGGLLLVNAVKQAVPMRPQWRTKKEIRRMAPVAYPRVASWQRIKP